MVDGYETFKNRADKKDVCQIGSGANLLYKEFVKDVVTRYKDRSIIFAWEIGNEGHLYCPTTGELLEWYNDTAALIKSIDRNHLVSTGENNFGTMDRNKFNSVHYVEGIDIASVHIYKDDLYGIMSSLAVSDKVGYFVSYWTNASHSMGKPVVFGEFGADVAESPDFYEEFLEDAYKSDADGVMLWSWMEGEDCSQSQSSGGHCVSPARTPLIVEDVEYWAAKFMQPATARAA
jgi:mannan endo-1,4-beta-mannosidase